MITAARNRYLFQQYTRQPEPHLFELPVDLLQCKHRLETALIDISQRYRISTRTLNNQNTQAKQERQTCCRQHQQL